LTLYSKIKENKSLKYTQINDEGKIATLYGLLKQAESNCDKKSEKIGELRREINEIKKEKKNG